MTLFGQLSIPYFRKHIGRTLLSIVGIALGVALLVAFHTADRAVTSAFASTVERVAGRARLQVTAGEPGFDEEVLDRVRAARSVRVAVPVVEAVVDTRVAGEGSLYVVGVDMLGDRSLRDYDFADADESIVDDPLVFLAQPDSLIVSHEFAARTHTHVGDRLILGTALGDRSFVVRGVLKAGGMASAFGGNLAVMDIFAAQKMFQRGRKFDRIDLDLQPGSPVIEAKRELSALLGSAFQVEEPARRAHQIDDIHSAYSTMSSLAAAFGLLIGIFLVHSSFSIAVTQRRFEIGMLRALGATRTQIRSLFLTESALVGAVGSAFGVACGLLMAGRVAAVIGSIMEDLSGVAQPSVPATGSPVLLTTAFSIGLLTSMAAATAAASRAAALDPVETMGAGARQAIAAVERPQRPLIAAVLLVASVVITTVSGSGLAFYVGYGLVILAAALLTPFLVVVLSRAIRPVWAWTRPVEGALAVDRLIHAPLRNSATVCGLMLSLALAVTLAGTAIATYDRLTEWIESTLNVDLLVTSSPALVNHRFLFPAAMADDIRKVAGVADVQAVRVARIGTSAPIIALDAAALARTSPPKVVAGDPDEMFRLVATGHGVIVSEITARLHHFQIGQFLEIPAPDGVIRLPIVGIVVDISDQQGAILLDRALFIRHWHDDRVNLFRVFAAPNTPDTAIKRRILERFAGERQVFVMTNAELRKYVLKLNEQWFGLSWVQVAVAVLVAVLGIANGLVVSIADRLREFAILKALGGMPAQIRLAIWLEALAIAAVGLFLGFVLGAVNLAYVLHIARDHVLGMTLDYTFPFKIAAVLVAIMIASASVAAIWPAEYAARCDVASALEAE